MKFLADESFDQPIIMRLRLDGHDVVAIAERSPGIADPVVLALAVAEQVVLLTADKDFGELVYRHRLPHAGVLLVRLEGMTEFEKCELVSRVVVQYASDLPGAFSVATHDSLRIRKAPLAMP